MLQKVSLEQQVAHQILFIQQEGHFPPISTPNVTVKNQDPACRALT